MEIIIVVRNENTRFLIMLLNKINLILPWYRKLWNSGEYLINFAR